MSLVTFTIPWIISPPEEEELGLDPSIKLILDIFGSPAPACGATGGALPPPAPCAAGRDIIHTSNKEYSTVLN